MMATESPQSSRLLSREAGMVEKPDRVYFAEREAAERAAAEAAASPEAKLLHLQMADHYAAIVSGMDEVIEELTGRPFHSVH